MSRIVPFRAGMTAKVSVATSISNLASMGLISNCGLSGSSISRTRITSKELMNAVPSLLRTVRAAHWSCSTLKVARKPSSDELNAIGASTIWDSSRAAASISSSVSLGVELTTGSVTPSLSSVLISSVTCLCALS